MLYLYRRHLKTCPHKQLTYKRCKCPIYLYGRKDGKRVRQALDTRNWEVAEQRFREYESGKVERFALTDCWDKFLADCSARKLTDVTIGKFKLIRREMAAFFREIKISAIDSQWLDEFRQSWVVGPITGTKKLERMKSFFRFCADRKYILENPARVLKPPKTQLVPKLPFTAEEMKKILEACDKYPGKGIYGENTGKRMNAMTLLLRYSGLRIRDAACLPRSALSGGRLLLRTQKTGSPVYVPLPDEVLRELENIGGSEYFFWSGNGDPKSTVGDWQRSFRKLFELAEIKGNPHRFRTSFAVSLLEEGVPVDRVAMLPREFRKGC